MGGRETAVYFNRFQKCRGGRFCSAKSCQRHADVVLRLNIVRITPHDGPKVFQGALIVPVLERENCLSLMVGRRERIAVSGAFLTAPCLGDERRKRPRKTKDRETDS